jgi:hypothetical protein
MVKRNRTSAKHSTRYSRVVSYHSTDRAIISLTSGIRRDPVLSDMYGRVVVVVIVVN